MAKNQVESKVLHQKAQMFGYKNNNALIPHNQAIIIPKDASENIQYEGELVVVIGKLAKI